MKYDLIALICQSLPYYVHDPYFAITIIGGCCWGGWGRGGKYDNISSNLDDKHVAKLGYTNYPINTFITQCYMYELETRNYTHLTPLTKLR